MRAYLLGGRPIHFPFASGMLRYECEGCDAPCCKATPIGVGRSRELRTLGKAQSRLPLFATPGFYGSPLMSIQSPREACWFLDPKKRCRLERRVGRYAKPAGCRLYPFQRVRSMGRAITVLPDFTCPLTVARAPSDEGPTSHDELCLEMHRVRLPAKGHPSLPPPADADWPDAARLEGRIVRRIHRYLGDESYLAFAEKQQALTAELLGWNVRDDELSKLDRRIRARVGVGEASAAPVHDLVALTGVLRVMTSGLPRADMPGLLLACAVLLEAYDEMLGVTRTARTVISLYEQRLPLLYVLAHLRDRPTLKEGADPKRLMTALPAVRRPLLKVLQAVVDNRRTSRPRRLDEILDEQAEVFAPPLSFEAAAMLYALGRVLMSHGTFVTLGSASTPGRPTPA